MLVSFQCSCICVLLVLFSHLTVQLLQFAGYFWGPRIPKQECYSYNYQHDGDRLDNPVFGSETGLTLDECKTKCATTVDEYNRTCVAIEWKDGGEEQLANYTAKCILAWACDYTEDFGGNSVFMRLGTFLIYIYIYDHF